MPKKSQKKGENMPMPLAEMNECCKVVAGIKDGEIKRNTDRYEEIIKHLNGVIDGLEQHASEKGRIASSLEGQIAALKHQIAPAQAQANREIKYTPSKPGTCVVCSKECISRCPECKASVCDKQTCGQAHGHTDMYR